MLEQPSLSETISKQPENTSGTAFGGLLGVAGDLKSPGRSMTPASEQLALNAINSPENYGAAVRDMIDFRDKPTEVAKPIDMKTYENKAFDAYTQALADGKHTMILFSARPCGFCKTMKENLASPELSKYSNDLVAAVSYRGEDQGGDHLAAALNIQRYPTTIVLQTDMDRLHVVGRIEGVFDPKEISKVLDEALKDPVKKPVNNNSMMV